MIFHKENLKDRLLKIIEKNYSGKIRAFAKDLDISEQTVRSWVGNKMSWPDANKIQIICHKTGISADWLLMGEGSMQDTGYKRLLKQIVPLGSFWLNMYDSAGIYLTQEQSVDFMIQAFESMINNVMQNKSLSLDKKQTKKIKNKINLLLKDWKMLVPDLAAAYEEKSKFRDYDTHEQQANHMAQWEKKINKMLGNLEKKEEEIRGILVFLIEFNIDGEEQNGLIDRMLM